MKASFLSENINKKLSFVNHAVSNRSQLPVLLNFLLTTQKGKIFISATDLEIGIETNIPANIEEEGGITVPARVFFELISNIPKGKITLHTKGENLILESDKSKTVFQTMPREDFPKIYEDKGERIATIKKNILEKDFTKIVFAASQDSGRPALSGVLIKKEKEGKKSGFLLVATDGYRLSLKKEVDAQVQDKGEETTLLIPSRLIKELISLKEEDDIEIYASGKNNQVLFVQRETVLVGRLIEAEFPNYEKIIPADFSTRATVDKRELQSAVKTSAIFARETTNIVKFSLERNLPAGKAGKIIVTASAPSVGESTIEVEAKVDGEENEIAFNARYLLEFLGNIDEEQIVFEMSGPLNPGVFKIAGDPTYLHIIMPIRVQN